VLPYCSPKQRYVPPYYPERGQGIVGSILKLLFAATLALIGCFTLLIGLLITFRPTRASGGAILVALLFLFSISAASLTSGFVFGRRGIRSLWRLWQDKRIRRDR
jgi:hypothetical protein